MTAAADSFDTCMAQSEACRRRGEHQRGAEWAAGAFAAAGRPEERAKALALRALHCTRLADFVEAMRSGQQALDLFHAAGDALGASGVHATLALACFSSNMPTDALHHAMEALRTADAVGDLQARCWALNRLAMAYRVVGEFERAIESGQGAMDLARELDDEVLFGAVNNQAAMLNDMAEESHANPARRTALLEQGLALAREAMAIAQRSAHPHRQAVSRNVYADMLTSLGRHAEARDTLQEVLTAAQTHGFEALAQLARIQIAKALRAEGRLGEAIAACEPLVDDRADEKATDQAVHQLLYEMHKQADQPAQALMHHEVLMRLSLADQEARFGLQSRMLMVKYELQAAQEETQRARLDAEMQRLRAEALDRTAQTDPLTGAFNRRFLEAQLPRLRSQAQATGAPLSGAMLDIDHFKAVNDRFGHAVGDQVLIALSQLVTTALRGGDFVVRLGGEEFLAVFVGAPCARAFSISERVRTLVQEHAWARIHPALGLTISLGVAEIGPDEPAPAWMGRMDEALYQAKGRGRNQVVCADDQQQEE